MSSTLKHTRGYIDIRGLRTWFADSGGAGDAVLMLHAGISDSDMILEPLEPALGDRFRILAFDRRGHGYIWAVEPTLTIDDLRRISAPALVLVGDDDLMTLAHTASLYESLPAGQLAVVPGTSHAVVLEKPELVGRLIGDFLSAPGKPKTSVPVRRRSAGK